MTAQTIQTGNRTTRKKTARPGGWKIWLLYAAGFVPAVWTFYLALTGSLGADPVKTFEHTLGLWALRFLILTLMVTPIRDLTGIALLRYRRALGLLAFYYALMHFSTYMVLDQRLDMATIVADILRRPFITIGMASLLMLLPLALTSNNWSIRKLGRRWNSLHRLVYVAIAGGAIHFIMSVKSWPAEPVIYGAIVTLLLLWRLVRAQTRSRKTAARPRGAAAMAVRK
ncbi:sulfoxide reductase heme-binding subunit YedZ [Ochrobactrum daejeonense]|uniref:Protein-methionine-sulfoxide reductase heme-binding subunit MsrQ n=1 Tax=Brucella daejeonensis TaxID=659015 RepID=A0A7W9AYX8_9HYPH|nr:protein-methionine-sulfoxide reductase heme-binding subunit MsrQ [Brucella daejeonensis]MBB5703136.1 sulfoxide reductase heme-binding subunit YedZ [Brucella daejeonensis]